MSKKFYPSISKQKVENMTKNTITLSNYKKGKVFDFSPLTNIDGQGFNHEDWRVRFIDSWSNGIASINTNNSLMQFSEFMLKRKTYQELSALSTDDIIKNAIGIITRDILSKWGKIKIDTENDEVDTASIIKKLENRFKELNITKILNKSIHDALLYGGSIIYFHFDGQQEYDKELIIHKNTAGNRLLKFKVIEPYLIAPHRVNTTNPLDDDYMKPSEWYISGAGSVHSSRLYNMVFFEAPDLIKPLFNFLGISLTQFMFEKVKSAEIIRQSLADIFLRFRMDIIKTPALSTNNQHLLTTRIEAINQSKNNLGTLMLSDNEEFVQSITPIAGLDKIQAQAYEAIASSSTIPINKLFGQTPTGLNNSGSYDLANFNDTIKGYQNNIVKPFLDKVLSILINELGFDNVSAEFVFNPLEQLNELELAQANNLQADFYAKLIGAGVISQDDALEMLKSKDLINENIEATENDFDLDLDLDLDNVKKQEIQQNNANNP